MASKVLWAPPTPSLPEGNFTTSGLYASALRLTPCRGRSLQFRTILWIHVASCIPWDSSTVRVQALPVFHGLRPYPRGSTSHLSTCVAFLTIRQNSLHVTTCILASTLLGLHHPPASHAPFLPRMGIGYWGFLAITPSGLSPAVWSSFAGRTGNEKPGTPLHEGEDSSGLFELS